MKDLGSRLPELSLNRRITVMVMLASVLVVGAVATARIPLELIPRGFSEPFLRVLVPWRDAPPEEVVEKIVRPLEEELATVGGLSSLDSRANPGVARVFMQFKQGTDMDIAYREVRDRIERARVRLPEDVQRVFIRKDDDTGIPVALYGLTIDPAVTDSYDLIRDVIVVALQRIDGVASVEVQGQLEKEILIELDRERTASAGLDIYRLAQDLAGDNFTLASGHVNAGGKKLLLRSVARYRDIEELRQRPLVTVPGEGKTVRLADVAVIRYAEPETTFRVRAMSLPAVALQVFKEGDANTVDVAGRVQEEIDRLRESPRLAGIGIEKLFNQREIIFESLGKLVEAGALGTLFAVLVLLFFLRRFRMTVIITLSIPLSLLVALAVMYFAGETLNIISLLGLMIACGILVDNSVVVAENIFRFHRDGLPARQACVEGAKEIALAITMGTMTTVIVFLPASLVEGEGQFFLIRLAMPICISVVASLVVALVLVPLAVYLTLSHNGGSTAQTTPFRRVHQRLNDVLRHGYEATMGRLSDFYERLLRKALPRRLDVAMLLIFTLAGTFALFGKRVEVVEQQEDEEQGFHIEVELPQDTTLEEAERFMLRCEKVVEGKKDAYQLAGWFVFHRATVGEIEGWFAPDRKNGKTPREITAELLKLLPEKPGVRFYTGQESEQEKEERATFRVPLFGEDVAELDATADAITARLLAVPGVLGVRKDADRPTEEIAMVVDRGRARRLGVSPQIVAAVVGYALRGQALPRYSRDGKEVPVRVRFREEDRATLGQLEDFGVPGPSGELVPLRSLTQTRFLPAPREIERSDRRTARELVFELAEGREKEARERMQAVLAEVDLPEGVRLGAQLQQGMPDDAKGLLFAVGLSIVFIYLLMAFLFESFVLPLSIVLTIPLAFLGVAWGHLIAGLDIDFLGMVGVVVLIGVVVNNGIVLIDYVNRLRLAGHERLEALVIATHRRFRPIMMTALTTTFGMVPLLLAGSTSIGLSYTSFAVSLVGGMTVATLLTLLVVPVFYTLFDDLGAHLGRALAWGAARRGRRRGAGTAAADGVETPA